jgi:hypothetical protein
MRVLYITTELPYPLTTGFLRHYHFLRVLGQRHSITYLSLTRKNAVPPETIAALRPYIQHMQVFGVPTASEPKLMKHIQRLPLVGGQFQRALRLRWAAQQMKKAVQQLVQQEPFDLVFFSGKDTFPAVEGLHTVPIVIDCCDATSLRVTGEMHYAGAARRLWLFLRWLEVRRIEKQLVRKTLYLAFASIRDQVAMLGHTGVGEIIPHGVDLQHWTRRTHHPWPNTIAFTGVMNYPPNHDAALWLIEKILPRIERAIPDVKVLIVGRDPLPALREAAGRRPNVTLTGQPEDMRTYFEQATVCCAPVRFASGMQFKVLEALAMEVPMVTTAVAANGLCVDGEQPPVVLGANAVKLAEAVIRLLQCPVERARLALEGRRYVARHFVWERSIEKLEKLWRGAITHWPVRSFEPA